MFAYVDANGVLIRVSQIKDPSPGETILEEPDGFWLEAGKWRWTGSAWVEHTPGA